MTRSSLSSTRLVAASLFTALIVAACGGGGAGNPAATAIPTSTPIPTYGIALPTSMLVVSTSAPTAEATEAVEATAEATTEATAEATAAAVASSGGLDATLVERGKGRYEALDCASCHGSDGSGTDDGVSLIASTQTEAEYIAFMRSGGALGTAHQYPANRLSDTGAKALYQYLLSLRENS